MKKLSYTIFTKKQYQKFWIPVFTGMTEDLFYINISSNNSAVDRNAADAGFAPALVIHFRNSDMAFAD